MTSRGLSRSLLALVIFLLSGLAQAAEFSATTIIRTDGQELQRKIYIKQDKVRMDSSGPLFAVVHILRLDKQVKWHLVPGERIFAETPLDRRAYNRLLDIPGEEERRTLASTETLNGYETEKYSLKSGPHQMARTVWYSKKLGVPIKIESDDKSVVTFYNDIKEGGVDDKIFEIPAGFQKVPVDEIGKLLSIKNIK